MSVPTGLAEDKTLEDMDKDELLAFADELGIEGLNRRHSENTIINQIKEAQGNV